MAKEHIDCFNVLLDGNGFTVFVVEEEVAVSNEEIYLRNESIAFKTLSLRFLRNNLFVQLDCFDVILIEHKHISESCKRPLQAIEHFIPFYLTRTTIYLL